MKPLFEVDKNACFAYWLQLVVGWSEKNEKRNIRYFQKYAGSFSKKERFALFLFKKILNKKKDIWLWNLYSNNSILNIFESLLYKWILFTLSSKFNAVWSKKEENLQQWKQKFTVYDFNSLDEAFRSVAIFFGVDNINELIKVKLFFGNEENANAFSFKKTPGIIIIAVPPFLDERFSSVLGSLIHEITHQIEYRSNIANILVQAAHKEAKKESGVSEFLGGSWYYLLRESIICSISTRRMVSYFGELIATPEEIKRDHLDIEDLRKNKKNLPLFVQYAAQKIKPILLEYLNERRVIDEKFYNFVIHIWIGLIKEL